MTREFRTFAQQRALEQESRRQWMIELLNGSASGAEAARIAGMDRGYFRKMAENLGVAFPNARGKQNRVEDYRRCAAEGMAPQQTAKALGVTIRAVYKMGEKYGIEFSDGRKYCSSQAKPRPKPSAKAKPSKPVSVPQESPINLMKRMAAAESAAMRRVGSR